MHVSRTSLRLVQVNNIMARYRVVTDKFQGFEVQYKVWWWPFWIQCSSMTSNINTHCTVGEAERFALTHADDRKKKKFKAKVVKTLGELDKYD